MTTPEIVTFSRPGRDDLHAALYRPHLPADRVLYAHLDGADAEAAAAALADTHAVLCALSGENWEAELSPWPAPRAFRRGSDFSGGAPEYLDFLCSTVLPAAESVLGLAAPPRGIAGYSLAGLFALWASLQRPGFSLAAGMSASLWYDGFADGLEAQRPPALPRYAYLSLGSAEPRARDPRLAAVGTCTERTAQRLASLGCAVDFHAESGGHFQDIPQRCARGLRTLAVRDLSPDALKRL